MPAWQGVHALDPAVDTCPAGHCVQLVPSPLLPAGQGTQLPPDTLYPAPQDTRVQEEAPALLVCPAAQLVQEVAPVPGEKVLAGQRCAEVAPWALTKDPAGLYRQPGWPELGW